MIRQDIRNIAIIAHVDHGKTTLVDAMLKQSHIFRENQKVEERVMDSNPLERERGITILAKNTSVMHDGVKINIVDTPGHADFGGEVERILNMVDGVILVVDSHEGPMPQTKYVLRKALEHHLKPIVVINKMDRPDQRISEVEGEVLDLFIELEADDEQLEFPMIYASARNGVAKYSMDDDNEDLKPLFDTIIKHCPAPEGDENAPLQCIVTTLDSDDYLGKVAIGRITRGTAKQGMPVCITDGEKSRNDHIGSLFVWQGMKRTAATEAKVGDIIAMAGFKDITIGETVADSNQPEALPRIKIDEPTLSMIFGVNKSPFAGQDGDYVTSRHIRARLLKEIETNVALRVENTETADAFKVSGRGELHLSVLIENMRREGYEFAVSKPEVLYKTDERGKKLEPMEIAYVDVPEEFSGTVIQKLSERKGELQGMSTASDGTVRLEFHIPSRGLIGFRGEFLTSTKGTGIINTMFDGYAPYKGDFQYRKQGSLIAFEAGEAVTYGLFAAQERGTLFIGPGAKVYSGMVIGQNGKAEDIELNVCKTKHLTNTRSSSADDALKLTPPRVLSLEQAIDFIDQDELLEVTPESLRIRKRLLDSRERKRAAFRKA